jgi:peptidoglycan/xylan/chitin deacetylase (PgdA/CDA1 family)
MLSVYVPRTYSTERAYIVSVLLDEFLGLPVQIIEADRHDWLITAAASDRRLSLADCFFAQPAEDWLKPASLPIQPLKVWSGYPVIYGDDPTHPNFVQQTHDSIQLGLDIFGSAFFMLTRYEEVVKPDRDRFDRFPATASLAYQEGFLDRPIINEYLELLWSYLKTLWPTLQRKPRQFKTYLSHDVDEPFRFAFSGVRRLAKRCAGDLVYRKSPIALVKSVHQWSQVKVLQQSHQDPANTFDVIMDLSERHNLHSAFYFITDHSAGAIDGDYNMDHPLMRQLLRQIRDRGHEVGLHTSYNTYQDSEQTQREFHRLQQVCQAEKIEQQQWGGRQHYLRWQTPVTWQNWAAAGLDYDSTMGYADRIGFRCGICYEFPVFDVVQRQALKLRERPLCVMDVTVTRSAYMGLRIDNGEALAAINRIKQHCQSVQGDFTLLWHNTGFIAREELELYQGLLCS